MKKFLAGFILLAILAVGGGGILLYSQKETLLASKITRDFKALAGADLALEGLSINRAKDAGFFTLDARISKAKIKNPPGFKIPNLAQISNIHFEVELLPLLSGKWQISRLSALLSKTNFEWNKEGDFNMKSLFPLQDAHIETGPAQPAVAKGRFYIGRLEIALGMLYYLNGRGAEMEVERINLEKKIEVYDGVTDPNILIQAPVLHFVTRLNKGSLELPRGKLQENVSKYTGQ